MNQYAVSTEQNDSPPEPSETKSVEEALKDCIEHHLMILEFSKKLEDLFRWFSFSKLFNGGI